MPHCPSRSLARLPLALAALLTFSPITAHATTVVVPDDHATIQAALDSDADSVLIKDGIYPEQVSVRPEHALLLAGHPDNAGRPRIAGLTIVHGGFYRFRGLHVESQVVLNTTGDSEPMDIDECRLDAGLIHHVGDLSDLSPFHVRRCWIRGDVVALPAGAVFESDTITAGGIRISGETMVTVRNCVLTGPGEYGIFGNFYSESGVEIRGCEISGYNTGIFVRNQDSHNEVHGNTITDCSGFGIVLSGSASATGNILRRCGGGVGSWTENYVLVGQNLIEDCRIGIALGSEPVYARVLDNRVLRSLEQGISLEVTVASDLGLHVAGNVVGRSGGAGIAIRNDGRGVAVVIHNTVFANGGHGIVVDGDAETRSQARVEGNIGFGNQVAGLHVRAPDVISKCNDWFQNGAAATIGVSGTDFEVDPRFCDLAHDQVTLASDSPLLDAPGCGRIGALGQGCTIPVAQPGLARRVVTPCDLAGWAPLPGSDHAARISAVYPHARGSLELDASSGMAVVGFRLPIAGHRLAELSALEVELFRDARSSAKKDLGPAVRLLVENAAGQRSLLVWEPGWNGFEDFPAAAWTHVVPAYGRFWQIALDGGVERVIDESRTLAQWLDGKVVTDKDGDVGLPVGAEARVLAADLVVLPLEGGVFRGAADAFRIGFAGHDTEHDFEPSADPTLTLEAPPHSICSSPVVLSARLEPHGLLGVIEFLDGTLSLGEVEVPRFGWARLETKSLSVGKHALRAVYRGVPCVDSAGSAVLSHEVARATGSLGIVPPASPVSLGDPVVLTATVAPAAAGGEVEFFADGQPIGRAPLSAGTARLEIVAETEGFRSITAAYAGDDCVLGATATAVTLEVLGRPRLTIEDASRSEADEEPFLVFALRLSHPSNRPVTVAYATHDGSASAGDYQPRSGTLTIPPRALGTSIRVAVLGDTLEEGLETVMVRLTDVTVATLADSEAIGTILDDDAPQLVTEDARIVEGTRGITILNYPVKLSRPPQNPVEVTYRTYNGWASSPDDLVPAAGTVRFLAGEVEKSIPVEIVADSTEEGAERFGIDLWMVAGGDTQSASHIITIENDDARPTAYIDNVTVTEGDGGARVVTVHVRLSNPTQSSGLFVEYQTRNGTASSGFDYLTARGSVSFPANSIDVVFPLTLIGDAACETDERLSIVFECRLNSGQVNQGMATVTIVNDDDCTTPTLVSLLRAEAAPEGIELRWRFEDSEARTLSIERSAAADGPWSTIAPELREENGVQVALDRGVRAGAEYWYRIRVRSSAGEETELGPLSASAAAVTHSALGRVSPNPTRGPVRVEFSVARVSPVRLSVIDVQGRELARLAEGVHAPGGYLASWNGEDARGPAPAGLYFVRCEIAGQRWIRRLVVTR